MEHLKALCEVLQISIDEAVKGKPTEAVTGVETRLLQMLRAMPADRAEALLALGSMLQATPLLGHEKEPGK